RFYLANGRLLSSELKPLGDNSANFGAAVHSLTGSYMIGVDAGTRSRFRNAESSQSRGGKLYQIGDQRPLVTIPDLLVSPPNDRIGGYQASALSLDKRVLFVPEAKVIVTVPYTDDRLRVLPFDVQQALDASGVDYLIVDPAPPQTVELGKPYEYTLSVKSKRGGLKFTLDAGPEGLKVSDKGEVTWDVPDSLTVAAHPVIISVSDASGQSTFHTFEVTAPEVARRAAELAAAEAKRMQAERDQARASSLPRPPTPTPMIGGMQPGGVLRSTGFVPEYRTWSDRTGKHKIEAKFVEMASDKSQVVLQLKSGDRRGVALSQLSDADIYEAVRSDLLLKNRAGTTESPESPESPFRPQ
ncbi:MAG: hypothetical protein KDB14_26935, partial [Planctomycetales bacterium]|nr:hypothetical protein [Planctomycetales bacterium]